MGLGEQMPQLPARWLRLVLAILLAQMIFWIGLDPLLSSKPDISKKLPVGTMEVATLNAPTADALSRADFKPVEKPWSDCCSGGYRAARYHITLRSLPREGFVASSLAVADNLEIYVNGQLAFSHGRMDRANPSYQGNMPRYYSLPSALFRNGENTIDVVMVRGKMPWFDAGTMVFGERQDLIAGYDQRSLLLNDFVWLSMGIGAVLALLALVIAIRSNDRSISLWTALTAAAWVLWIAFYQWTDPPFSPEGRLLYYFACACLAPICWLGLITAWTGKQSRWTIGGMFGAYAATMIAIAWQLHWGGEGGYDSASDLTNYFGLATTALTVVVFGWHFRKGAELRIAETAILMLCVTVLACEFYWEMRWQTVFGRINIVSIPFLLAFVVAYLARNFRLFQSAEQINTLLQSQLTQRTAELEAAHLRERELVRAQAHQAERQRIMRDMHDGLGSQLMSMLLAARRGVAKPATVAEGLQSVIDEMRLLIDSMDSVGESLGSAFAMFRERVQGRVEEAGMAFHWQDDSQGQLPDMGPREVLQVFRIMQEAVTNALKHSTGTALSVNIAPSPEADRSVRIAISDNGGGLGKANPRGKGMDSMAARAEGIGGKLQVQSGAKGVSVILDLPQR